MLTNNRFLALCQFNNCNPYELNAHLTLRREENLQFLKDIGPLTVDYSASHPEFTPDGISILSASVQKAFNSHRSGTTVEQFVFSKYGRTLNQSYLFCIFRHGGQQKNGNNF